MRKPTKEDLLWCEKNAPAYEIGKSAQAMKRSNPTAKLGLYLGDFDEITPADSVFLTLCRTECDILVVLIPSDYSMRINGQKPRFSTDERLFRLGSLSVVGFTSSFDEADPTLAISKIGPDIVFYGRTEKDIDNYKLMLNKDKLFEIETPFRETRKFVYWSLEG